jgi:hypothetical protein
MFLRFAKVIVPACVTLMLFILFTFGAIQFHDGPIRACPEHGYCGKYGHPHTLEHFEQFKTWQTIFVFIGPIGVLFLVAWKKEIIEPLEAEIAKQEAQIAEEKISGETLGNTSVDKHLP